MIAVTLAASPAADSTPIMDSMAAQFEVVAASPAAECTPIMDFMAAQFEAVAAPMEVSDANRSDLTELEEMAGSRRCRPFFLLA